MARSMARWAASELARSDRKCVMVTLTFDGMPEDWTGKDCTAAFNRFMVRFKRQYWCRDYLVCRELQDRGVYHYHMIVFDVDWLPFAEIELLWGCGFVWLTAFDQPSRAVKYALKYVDKGGRLHGSFHLLESTGARAFVRAWRAFARTLYLLGEAFRCGRIDLAEHHRLLLAEVCG